MPFQCATTDAAANLLHPIMWLEVPYVSLFASLFSFLRAQLCKRQVAWYKVLLV